MRKLMNRMLTLAVAACAFAATPAAAQATRTWVSGVGDDVNPCSRTAPCKTFAGAISKTAAGGEINCLDPGGFGGVTITKALTILCDGVVGGALAGGNAINVNAGVNDRVVLKGLDIFAVNPVGAAGVNVIQARDVIIIDTNIQGFGAGVLVAGSTKMRVTVHNSRIIGNTVGVSVTNSGGMGSAKVVDTLFAANTEAGIRISGSGNRGTLTGNSIIGSVRGLELLTGGTAISFGNNSIDGPTDSATITPQN